MTNKFLKQYIDFLKKKIKIKRSLRIVFDCSNGTTGLVLKELFSCSVREGGNPEKTGFRIKCGMTDRVEPIFINEKPDGNFPGHGPNPLKDGALNDIKKAVKKHRADLGIIFDGDGDRVFFIDNLGDQIDPDIVASILMKKFKTPYVVTTISSWRVKKVKGAIISKVGHLFMKEMMRKKKANLGMERSGHYYFKDFFNCDSGIFAAIEIMNFVGELGGKISSYVGDLPKYHQIPETNFKIESEAKLNEKMEKIKNIYKNRAVKISENDGLLMEFRSLTGEWWFSLRLSNSENLLRLNMEAGDEKTLNFQYKKIKQEILSG